MKRITQQFLLLMALLTISLSVFAASISPTGNWTTISDKDGKPRSIVKIYMSGNTLNGRVVKVFPRPGDKGICTQCKGSRKNKKILGMIILWGMKKSSANVWSGGRILDPKNGKVYRCKITVGKNGKRLIVRGYVGISLLGRNQTWIRR